MTFLTGNHGNLLTQIYQELQTTYGQRQWHCTEDPLPDGTESKDRCKGDVNIQCGHK